jgi:hypothetical protein
LPRTTSRTSRAGDQISDVATVTVPVIAQVWMVNIRYRVTQPNGVLYNAVMILLVEPVTGS